MWSLSSDIGLFSLIKIQENKLNCNEKCQTFIVITQEKQAAPCNEMLRLLSFQIFIHQKERFKKKEKTDLNGKYYETFQYIQFLNHYFIIIIINN